MMDYNFVNLVLSTITLFLTIGGLYYAGYQIKLAREQLSSAIDSIELTRQVHQDNHDWNRRIAAQEAIVNFRNQNKTKELREALGQIDINDAIPLETILAQFKTDPNLRGYIFSVLNTFEGYARGIQQGIYDEEVIMKALMGTMIRYFNCFRPYIIHIRKVRNPALFLEFEAIVNKWKSELNNLEMRSHTGEK